MAATSAVDRTYWETIVAYRAYEKAVASAHQAWKESKAAANKEAIKETRQ